METISEAAIGYASSKSSSDVFIESHIKDFKAGVEFAQRWIPVEEELPEIGEEVLVKRELRQGDTWVQRFCSVSTRLAPSGEWEDVKWSDVGHTRGIVTHWRPIGLK